MGTLIKGVITQTKLNIAEKELMSFEDVKDVDIM